ncbi:GntT/GntP/DsdX family permease [Bacillus cereus]|uniref:GntT/GntP/DsdX family permease n=1 Tax=Bacillus cereus TaxID=1396 RepID=UPI00398399E4
MTAIGIYNANLGKVLLYSLIIALPTAIIAGPIFAKWVHKRVIPEMNQSLFELRLSQLICQVVKFHSLLFYYQLY